VRKVWTTATSNPCVQYSILSLCRSRPSPDNTAPLCPLIIIIVTIIRLYNVPWSISSMVSYLNTRYGNPEIWVLENGVSEKAEASRTGAARYQDPFRTKFFRGYVNEVCKARKSGVKVTHYFVWSFTDNWEWREGFSTRFGIVHIDFNDKALPRTPKDSAKYLSQHVFKKSSKQ